MIGKHIIEILNADLLSRGLSSSDHISDGGFSPDSEGVNLIANPGLLQFPAALTDGDSDNILNAAGDTIIASCPDDVTFLGKERKVVNGVGEYVQYDGTKLGAVLRTDSGNNDQYNRGLCHMVNYGGEIYTTNRKNLVRWDEVATTFDVTFLDFSAVASLSGLADVVPHPLLAYENNLYTASHNELFRTTTPGTAPTVILTLANDQVITALGIDPGSGKMLIATSTAMNVSLTVPALNKVLWYDGFSNKVIKSIVVEDAVIAFHSHGGVVYIGYGMNLGYLTGSGIQFLRKLNLSSRSSETLPYKASFASIGKTLYVTENDKVLALGETFGGRKTFYYVYGDTDVTKNISHIFDAGDDNLGLSFPNEAGTDAEFKILDTLVVSTVDDSSYVTNWFHFPRPIYPRMVLVEFGATITSSNFSLFYQAETDTAHNSNSLAADISAANFVKRMTGFLNERVTALKFLFGEGANNNKGIRRAILYYDVAE